MSRDAADSVGGYSVEDRIGRFESVLVCGLEKSILLLQRVIEWKLVMQGIIMLFFFFQAEDGIRDSSVTGVQTCALPISAHSSSAFPERPHLKQWKVWAWVLTLKQRAVPIVEPCKGQAPRCWPARSERGDRKSVV